jgi:hypothetical protein
MYIEIMSSDSNDTATAKPNPSDRKLELAEKSIAIISVTSGLVSAVTPLLMNIEDIADAVNGDAGQLSPSMFFSFANPAFLTMMFGICATIFGGVLFIIMKRRRMSRLNKSNVMLFRLSGAHNLGRESKMTKKNISIIYLIVGAIGSIVGGYFCFQLIYTISSLGLDKAWITLLPAIVVLMCGIGIFIVGLKGINKKEK